MLKPVCALYQPNIFHREALMPVPNLKGMDDRRNLGGTRRISALARRRAEGRQEARGLPDRQERAQAPRPQAQIIGHRAGCLTSGTGSRLWSGSIGGSLHAGRDGLGAPSQRLDKLIASERMSRKPYPREGRKRHAPTRDGRSIRSSTLNVHHNPRQAGSEKGRD